MDADAKLARFSGFSERLVQVAAPGLAIPTLTLSGAPKKLTGGSFSTAMVSAAVAMSLAKDPTASAEVIKDRIARAATVNPNLTGKVSGSAILHVGRLLR